MKEACRIANETQKVVEKAIKPGVSTKTFRRNSWKVYFCHKMQFQLKKNYPSYYKDVPAFPATLCISINDILIHGIPSDRIIVKDGRHCKYRFSCIKNEFHGDCARTYLVGNVSKEAKKLVETTKKLFEGIKLPKRDIV